MEGSHYASFSDRTVWRESFYLGPLFSAFEYRSGVDHYRSYRLFSPTNLDSFLLCIHIVIVGKRFSLRFQIKVGSIYFAFPSLFRIHGPVQLLRRTWRDKLINRRECLFLSHPILFVGETDIELTPHFSHCLKSKIGRARKSFHFSFENELEGVDSLPFSGLLGEKLSFFFYR